MSIPIVLFIIIAIVIIINIRLRMVKPFRNVLQAYLAEERDLNLSPKKEISKDYFVTPDLNRLPIRDEKSFSDEERVLATKQNRVIKKSQLQMIKFKTSKGNRQLKSEFGIANFNIIVEYEENFSIFVRAIIEWAEALIDKQFYGEAEQALRESIRLGSDYLKNFTLLADIYAKTDPEKLNAFADEIRNMESFGNQYSKEKSLEYISGLDLS